MPDQRSEIRSRRRTGRNGGYDLIHRTDFERDFADLIGSVEYRGNAQVLAEKTKMYDKTGAQRIKNLRAAKPRVEAYLSADL